MSKSRSTYWASNQQKLIPIAIILIGPELMVVFSSFRVLSDVKEKDTCCFGLGCSSSVSLYFWSVSSDRLINNALYNPHRQWPN